MWKSDTASEVLSSFNIHKYMQITLRRLNRKYCWNMAMSTIKIRFICQEESGELIAEDIAEDLASGVYCPIL